MTREQRTEDTGTTHEQTRHTGAKGGVMVLNRGMLSDFDMQRIRTYASAFRDQR